MLLVAVGLAALAYQSSTSSIDFPVYHRAAQQILAHDYDLYPVEAYGGEPHPGQGFRYLPAVAFLFVPLGWLPLEAAALLFFCLKLAVLWWVGQVIARRLDHGALETGVFIAAFVVVGGYLAEEMRFGNVHLFIVALMVLAFDGVERGRVAMPAAALAIAVATKITPLALLGYFALKRRVAVCVATLAMLVALVVLPALPMGVNGNMRQLRAFASYALEKVDEGDNYSMRGLLVRYLTPGVEDSSHIRADVANLSMRSINVLWLGGLAVLGGAALVALWRDVDDPQVRLLELSLVLTGVVLASPHTQRRYYVALWVPAVLLVSLWSRMPHVSDRRWVGAGLLAMALPASILPLFFGGHQLALIYEAGSPYTFGALALFVVVVVMTRARKLAAPARADRAESAASGGNLSRRVGV